MTNTVNKPSEWAMKRAQEIYNRDPHALKTVIEIIAETIEAERSRAEKLVEALENLQYGTDPRYKCFCDIAIGNPMYRGHSNMCKKAFEALADWRKEGECI